MMKSTSLIPSCAKIAGLSAPLANIKQTRELITLFCIVGLQAFSASALAEGDERAAAESGQPAEKPEQMIDGRSLIRDLSDHYTFKAPGYHGTLLSEFNSLQDRGKAAFPELLSVFRTDENLTVRMLAARALAQISNETKDPAQLETVTNEIVPVLGKTINDPASADPIKRKAIAVLAHVKTDASVEILSTYVKKEDSDGKRRDFGIFNQVVKTALEALARMDTDVSSKALASMMTTSSYRVRERASWAFRDHGGVRGARVLLPKLSEAGFGHEYLNTLEILGNINRRVKDATIAKALQKHVDDIAIKKAALTNDGEPLPQIHIGSKALATDYPTASCAIEALGAIGGDNADALLLQVITNDPTGFSLIHGGAMSEISKSSSLETAKKLLQIMHQREDAKPKAECAEVIAAICSNSFDRAAKTIVSKEVIPEMVSTLMGKRYGFYAAQAIGNIGSAADIAYLQKVGEDHPKFASSIGEAIMSIEKRESRHKTEMAMMADGSTDGELDAESIVRRLARYDELMGVDTMFHGISPSKLDDIGNDAAPELLDIMRNYKDPAGRVLAARVLVRISDNTGDASLVKAVAEDAFPVLKQTLKDLSVDDELKGHIIETLPYIKTDASVELLVDDFTYSSRNGINTDTLEALEKFDTDASRKALVSLLINKPDVFVFNSLGRVGGVKEANLLFERLHETGRPEFAIIAMGLINQRLKDPGLDEKLNECVDVIDDLIKQGRHTGWAIKSLDTIRNQKAEDLRINMLTNKRMRGFDGEIAESLAKSESLETARRMLPAMDNRNTLKDKKQVAAAISSICLKSTDPGKDQFVSEEFGPKIIAVINSEATSEYFILSFIRVLGEACSYSNKDLFNQINDPSDKVKAEVGMALEMIQKRDAGKDNQ